MFRSKAQLIRTQIKTLPSLQCKKQLLNVSFDLIWNALDKIYFAYNMNHMI